MRERHLLAHGGCWCAGSPSRRARSPARLRSSLSGAATNGPTTSVVDDLTVTTTSSNAAPAAAFTASVTGMTDAVDATGSSDPDGTIVSYAWDFGDGTAAHGIAATHDYTAGGTVTVTVTLTVTDISGATGRTTRQAPIAAPAHTPIAADAERVLPHCCPRARSGARAPIA